MKDTQSWIFLGALVVSSATLGYAIGSYRTRECQPKSISYPKGSCSEQIAECRKRDGYPNVKLFDDVLQCLVTTEIKP